MPNCEVLQQLKRVVEDAPVHLFHMRAVVEISDTCGTARCALGWSIIDPWFQQNTRINEVLPSDFNEKKFQWKGDILLEVFGLTPQQFNDLFGCELSITKSYAHAVSRAEVLDNIDRLLSGEEPIRYPAVRSVF